jgi:hypothetical protein
MLNTGHYFNKFNFILVRREKQQNSKFAVTFYGLKHDLSALENDIYQGKLIAVMKKY